MGSGLSPARWLGKWPLGALGSFRSRFGPHGIYFAPGENVLGYTDKQRVQAKKMQNKQQKLMRWAFGPMVVSIMIGLFGPSVALGAGGDAAAGSGAAAPCSACHGQDGATGLDPSYPNLAGQNEAYLFAQLQMIQDDRRPIPLMAGQLNGKSEQDLRNLAAYYASLPAKIGQAEGDDDSIAAARLIYKGGIIEKGVAACAACHGPSGSGNMLAGYPNVGGQSPTYTINQLKAYREAQRTTDEAFGGMMRGVAAGLTDTEIELLAAYLSGLH